MMMENPRQIPDPNRPVVSLVRKGRMASTAEGSERTSRPGSESHPSMLSRPVLENTGTKIPFHIGETRQPSGAGEVGTPPIPTIDQLTEKTKALIGDPRFDLTEPLRGFIRRTLANFPEKEEIWTLPPGEPIIRIREPRIPEEKIESPRIKPRIERITPKESPKDQE